MDDWAQRWAETDAAEARAWAELERTIHAAVESRHRHLVDANRAYLAVRALPEAEARAHRAVVRCGSCRRPLVEAWPFQGMTLVVPAAVPIRTGEAGDGPGSDILARPVRDERSPFLRGHPDHPADRDHYDAGCDCTTSEWTVVPWSTIQTSLASKRREVVIARNTPRGQPSA